jgi:predicted Fe-Mo cluster-binding NifX family protein
MSDRLVVAVPSNGEGGLAGQRSAHFGHCDCFTVVDVQDGVVTGVRVIDNLPHVEGGCLRPVQLLANEGVGAIVVPGIGRRPLAGFAEAGIAVYFDNRLSGVGEVVDALLAGSVGLIDPSHACGHHH